VIEIMKANSRLPDFLEADMWAGISGARSASAGSRSSSPSTGRTRSSPRRELPGLGEQVSLRPSAAAEGDLRLARRQDDGRVYTVSVEIGDGSFIVVDLRGNPDQDPSRQPRPQTLDDRGADDLQERDDPTGVANGGSFRPLTLLTRPGSIFDAASPRRSASTRDVDPALRPDLALSRAAPRAGFPQVTTRPICGTFIGGRHPDTGRHFTVVEPQLGGWGASRRHGHEA